MIFAGYTGSKNQVRTWQKIKFVLKLNFFRVCNKLPNWLFKNQAQIDTAWATFTKCQLTQNLSLLFSPFYKNIPIPPSTHRISQQQKTIWHLRRSFMSFLWYQILKKRSFKVIKMNVMYVRSDLLKKRQKKIHDWEWWIIQILFHFFTCIFRYYVAHEIFKEFWKNSHFENMTASFLRVVNYFGGIALKWCILMHEKKVFD